MLIIWFYVENHEKYSVIALGTPECISKKEVKYFVYPCESN
jgi:hypothetical protein